MVDRNLPLTLDLEHPLRWMFLDLNAYFASVEQAEDKSLRGKPVAVVPVEADTTFCIAASYEAKAFGIKTGTRVDAAKALCPGLICIQARPPLYVHYHNLIIEAVETVLPVDKVCSIDEMRMRLLGEECQPQAAHRLASEMKAAIKEHVAENVTCSIGLAPNPFLAKVASDMQKPDGLVTLMPQALPDALSDLRLTEFTGINKKMAARLGASGVFSAKDMIACSAKDLRKAFGSVVGERWYYLLRGYDVPMPDNPRRSLGHSHVLPPKLRTRDGARQVMLRLASKAMARLRSNELWAQHMTLSVRGMKRSWSTGLALPPTQDTTSIIKRINEIWESADFESPLTIGVTFTNLGKADSITPSLFDQDYGRDNADKAVDTLNQKFGKNTVYVAALDRVKNTATEKIAFDKTWLMSEGKGDNVWVPDPSKIPNSDESD